MTIVPQLVPQCDGVVLELGPGLGNQLCRFDKSKVTRILGVECNPYFIPDCQKQIEEQGLEDKYELITSSIQDSDVLERYGIEAGSLDTVLSIQVLCSVPNPTAVVKELYRLLKPGGKLIFWEHHRSSDWITAAAQYFWNPFWWPFVGGCNLTRDTRAVIAAAGEWENYDSIEGDEKPWSMMPRPAVAHFLSIADDPFSRDERTGDLLLGSNQPSGWYCLHFADENQILRNEFNDACIINVDSEFQCLDPTPGEMIYAVSKSGLAGGRNLQLAAKGLASTCDGIHE
ncbi:hypothetical protein DCS_01468 [Drechmeria coniospora]|uniref:Methyltransferase type 11 domain-containing protein n=1 Tax=Drechmeria coniospora TaxID=98403 RepID=A0A151GTD6_DRECN|nr:hypothetical protein DCS_01468 [Drechmeria coniospora]KYK60331.1 hypothetical protein DCS_01468 [Drechmeria coniospora]